MASINLTESVVSTLEANEYCGVLSAPGLDEIYYNEKVDVESEGYETHESIDRYSDDWFDFMAEHGWKEEWVGGTMSGGAKYPAIKKVCRFSDCGNCS